MCLQPQEDVRLAGVASTGLWVASPRTGAWDGAASAAEQAGLRPRAQKREAETPSRWQRLRITSKCK